MLSRGRDSEGGEVMRSYTPITLDSDVGYFELVVKVQFLCIYFWQIIKKLFMRILMYINYVVSYQMYPYGKMSHHFRQMKEGDSLAVKGPKVLYLPC